MPHSDRMCQGGEYKSVAPHLTSIKIPQLIHIVFYLHDICSPHEMSVTMLAHDH